MLQTPTWIQVYILRLGQLYSNVLMFVILKLAHLITLMCRHPNEGIIRSRRQVSAHRRGSCCYCLPKGWLSSFIHSGFCHGCRRLQPIVIWNLRQRGRWEKWIEWWRGNGRVEWRKGRYRGRLKISSITSAIAAVAILSHESCVVMTETAQMCACMLRCTRVPSLS